MNVNECWRKVDWALRKGNSLLTLENVMESVERGDYEIRTHEGTVLVYEAVFEGGVPGVSVVAYHGDLHHAVQTWLPFLDRQAREINGRFVLVPGRLGWQRFLAQYGYDQVSVILRKDLKP